MNTYFHNDLKIEVFDWGGLPDAEELTNNTHGFRKQIMEDPEYLPWAIYGIRIYKGSGEINSCIISNNGSRTRVEEHSILKDADRLLIICCGMLYCLSIPELDLIWKVQAADYKCFEVYKSQDDYLTYGEDAIARIDKDGNILWQFKGAADFYSMYRDGGFLIESDHVFVKDVNDREYRIGFDGKGN